MAILLIRIVEGNGAVRAPGAQLARPLAVEITDDAGRPVPGASVSFHLPDDGPGGVFSGGLRTDVQVTDERGRASAQGIQFNRVAGPFEIRIIAIKDQVRAGTISLQYIAEAAPRAARRGRGKWILLGVAAAAGAAGAWSARGRAGAGGGVSAASPPAAVSIGAPSLVVVAP
ncbi:MAG: hypothetical protein ACE15B_08590 [Bryobacteraceae bacterium]